MTEKRTEKAQPTKKNPELQGEGDYRAAARYRKDLEHYLEEAGEEGVEAAAREAEHALDTDEREELEDAEKEGRSKMKEEDPLLHKRAKASDKPN